MGRVFAIELEGPVYTCTECNTHLGLPSDIISNQILNFSRLFNTFLAESKSNSGLPHILCVGCANILGFYGVSDKGGPYWVARSGLDGPEGSDDEV